MASKLNTWDHLGFPRRTEMDLVVEGHRDLEDLKDLAVVGFPLLARVDQACLLEDQDFLVVAEAVDHLHLPHMGTMGAGILKTPNGERRVP